MPPYLPGSRKSIHILPGLDRAPAASMKAGDLRDVVVVEKPGEDVQVLALESLRDASLASPHVLVGREVTLEHGRLVAPGLPVLQGQEPGRVVCQHPLEVVDPVLRHASRGYRLR